MENTGSMSFKARRIILLNATGFVGSGRFFMWITRFCPQACIATGDEPFRYLLYKDVNRHIAAVAMTGRCHARRSPFQSRSEPLPPSPPSRGAGRLGSPRPYSSTQAVADGIMIWQPLCDFGGGARRHSHF